jgi:hypothetical protein
MMLLRIHHSRFALTVETQSSPIAPAPIAGITKADR